MRRPLPLLLLSLPLMAAAPVQAQQVNRCTDARGGTVYSDRSCADLGATARLPTNAPSAGGEGLYRAGCTRRLSELVWQIRSAIDAHDVNQLSGIYLWNGVSDSGAGRILDRLEAVVQRPLVDIAPVYAELPPAHLEPAADDPTLAEAATTAEPPLPSAEPPRRRPIALRLEQTLANGSTPSRTVLGLRRQYNCFWISL